MNIAARSSTEPKAVATQANTKEILVINGSCGLNLQSMRRGEGAYIDGAVKKTLPLPRHRPSS